MSELNVKLLSEIASSTANTEQAVEAMHTDLSGTLAEILEVLKDIKKLLEEK